MSEILNGKGEGLRRLLLAFGLTLVIFGLTGLASAVDANAEGEEIIGIQCSGKVEPTEGSLFPDTFAYEFGCNQDISAFSLVSNRLIDNFATEVIGVDAAGEPGEAQDFFCTSTVPSYGFGCYGSPGKTPPTVITKGNHAIGEFSTFDPLCAANVQPKIWGIAQAEYSSTNDLTDPPSVRKWLATSEPFLLNSKSINCKVLNAKVKAKKACAKVKMKRKGTPARARARKQCERARAVAQKA